MDWQSHSCKIKPQTNPSETSTEVSEQKLLEGSLVDHSRFGKGKVLKIEGAGNDKKAEIQFERGDIKKLLLRFAKLRLLE